MTQISKAQLTEVFIALGRAVTDVEADEALRAARDLVWPLSNPDKEADRRTANRLLDGPSVGWIGLGILMIPEGWHLREFCRFHAASAAILIRFDIDPHPVTGRQRVEGRASRRDTALVCAALQAIFGLER